MSETPKSEVPEKDFSTDRLDDTLAATDAIILRIKTACDLVVRTMTAIDDTKKFQNSSLPIVREVYTSQFKKLLEQLEADEIKKGTVKIELIRKIEIINEAIKLHKGSFFLRDLNRALRILKKELESLTTDF